MKAIYSKKEATKRNKESKRRYYLRNKDKIDAYRHRKKTIRREENRIFINGYKKSHPCKCGESYLWCLDFHHLDPSVKDRCICHMKKSPVSLATLREEVKKCIVVCSNCHRKMHYPDKNREWNAKDERKNAARLMVWEYKKEFRCKCGEDHPSCLEFHHVSGNKEKNISKMAKDGYALKTIKTEIEKCEVICSNCHRKVHSGL